MPTFLDDAHNHDGQAKQVESTEHNRRARDGRVFVKRASAGGDTSRVWGDRSEERQGEIHRDGEGAAVGEVGKEERVPDTQRPTADRRHKGGHANCSCV